MLYVLLITVSIVLFEYMPMFHGKISESKREFIVFVCISILALALLIIFNLNIEIPGILDIIDGVFENFGLTYL